MKGKSVASRQPLVRAKNPWGAGEAESVVGSRYSDGPRDRARRRRRCLAELEFPRPCTLGGAVVYYVCTTDISELELGRASARVIAGYLLSIERGHALTCRHRTWAWTGSRGGRADVSWPTSTAVSVPGV